MAVKFFSCMSLGLQGKLIEIEVDILQGLSAFNIVGLGDAAVQEAKERIRSAIKNSGFTYPQTKKVINLAPANFKKYGPHFDLGMCVGILAASGQVPAPVAEMLRDSLIAGELALDGSVRPVHSVLTMALFAKSGGWKRLVIPAANFEEAALVKGIEILPVENLSELIRCIPGQPVDFKNQNGLNKPKNGAKSARAHTEVQPFPESVKVAKSLHVHTEIQSFSKDVKTAESQPDPGTSIDFSDVIGHSEAKRALTIAAAGGHHILLTGPPGVGKTMLAKAVAGILPELLEEELLEVMQIYSCAGIFKDTQLFARPFRQVHPTSTLLALTGGGTNLKPGEVTLAHRGVLFLDEIAEFPRAHLESLRQPLEEKEIYLSRASGSIKYPAGFFLIAGMNPCQCGYYGDNKKPCLCKPYQVMQYRKKLSGPILDRIDIIIGVQRQKMEASPAAPLAPTMPAAVSAPENIGQKSSAIKQKITAVRSLQKTRFKSSNINLNAEMTPRLIKTHCTLNQTCKEILDAAAEKFNFSGRNYHQVLKVARTIADLGGHDKIEEEDLSEALQYRNNFSGSGPSIN